MPVSNPSYFPDIRGNGSVIGITAGRDALGDNDFLSGNNAGDNSTANDLIIIGNGSGAAGIIGPDLVGSIMIGVGAAPLLTVGAGFGFPVTVIGAHNLAAVSSAMDSTVVIGSGILNGINANPVSRSVYIGNDLFSLTQARRQSNSSVVIGWDIASGGATQDSEPINAVMIGSRLFSGTAWATPYGGVIIGNDIDQAGSAPASGFIYGPNVIVGSTITTAAGPVGCVLIGTTQAYNGTPSATTNNNIVIGPGTSYSGNRNVVIGSDAVVPFIAADASFGNVVIGSSAGTSLPDTVNTVLVIESQAGTADPVKTLIYGLFTEGNLVLGNSVDGTNRDVGGTNTVKLLNGTIGGAAPVGGGYFYVVAGALHWVGSAGSDTVVAPA